MKAVSVYGLFATCALGMLNNDLDLSKMVLKELVKFQEDSKYAADISLFKAYTKFIEVSSGTSCIIFIRVTMNNSIYKPISENVCQVLIFLGKIN